ncbi:MAG: hypothetical protein HY552_06390 [Elusimicrobia bacterium]|nr:hypothetical protein [Elusimicrobiota bacterium]
MRASVVLALLLSAAPARADWLLDAQRAANAPSGAAPERPRDSWTSFTPESGLFSADLPAEGWRTLEEEGADGLVARALGPDEPGGTLRAALSVRLLDRETPGYLPAKEAVEALRRPDPALERSASPVRVVRTPAGLARVFEVLETRRLPADEGPSLSTQVHAYVAVIPRGDSYYLIRLLSTRAAYLDYRDLFARFLASFRAVGPR